MIETPVTVAALEANVQIAFGEWSAACESVDPIFQKYLQATEALRKEQLALGHVWTVQYVRYQCPDEHISFSEKNAVDWANQQEDEGWCVVTAILRPDGSQLTYQETGLHSWAVGK